MLQTKMVGGFLHFVLWRISWIHVTYFHKCFRCFAIRIHIFYYRTNVKLLFWNWERVYGMQRNAPMFNHWISCKNVVLQLTGWCFSCLFWTSVLCLIIICSICVYTVAVWYLPVIRFVCDVPFDCLSPYYYSKMFDSSDGFVHHSPSFTILLFMLSFRIQHTRCQSVIQSHTHQIPIPIVASMQSYNILLIHFEMKTFHFWTTPNEARHLIEFFFVAALSAQWVYKS